MLFKIMLASKAVSGQDASIFQSLMLAYAEEP